MKQGDNVIRDKSKKFAVRIVKLAQYLQTEKKEFVLSKQILKSGTSIGANVHEAIYAQSVPDFVSKLNIALKEAGETEYWLELLQETDYVKSSQVKDLKSELKELLKLLTAIITTTKKNNC